MKENSLYFLNRRMPSCFLCSIHTQNSHENFEYSHELLIQPYRILGSMARSRIKNVGKQDLIFMQDELLKRIITPPGVQPTLASRKTYQTALWLTCRSLVPRPTRRQATDDLMARPVPSSTPPNYKKIWRFVQQLHNEHKSEGQSYAQGEII